MRIFPRLKRINLRNYFRTYFEHKESPPKNRATTINNNQLATFNSTIPNSSIIIPHLSSHTHTHTLPFATSSNRPFLPKTNELKQKKSKKSPPFLNTSRVQEKLGHMTRRRERKKTDRRLLLSERRAEPP